MRVRTPILMATMHILGSAGFGMLTQGLWMDLLPKSSHVHSLGCERGFHLRLREGAGIGDMWRCTECYNIGIAICRRSPWMHTGAITYI